MGESGRSNLRATLAASPSGSNGGLERRLSSSEALLHQKPQVAETVAPRIQLGLTDSGGIQDGNLGETDAVVLQRFDLDFLGKSHSVGSESHAVQNRPP